MGPLAVIGRFADGSIGLTWSFSMFDLTLRLVSHLWELPPGVCSTLPEINSLHLKIDSWKTTFYLGWSIFWGYVSFRECDSWGKLLGQSAPSARGCRMMFWPQGLVVSKSLYKFHKNRITWCSFLTNIIPIPTCSKIDLSGSPWRAWKHIWLSFSCSHQPETHLSYQEERIHCLSYQYIYIDIDMTDSTALLDPCMVNVCLHE